MSRQCKNKPDLFCYVCGELTLKTQQCGLSPLVRKAYELYFGCRVGNQDKSCAPHICCNSCSRYLRNWLQGKRSRLKFAVPMVWREPTNHVTDCYFYLTDVKRFSSKYKHCIQYPNLHSAMRPVPHSEDLPKPTAPGKYTVNSEEDTSDDPNHQDPDFQLSTSMTCSHHEITQEELNDLVRDLKLSQTASELLGSRLQCWNLLEKGVKISSCRRRQSHFEDYFAEKEDIVYCCDVNGIFGQALGHEHNPAEWRMFIDSSKRSLKAVLLHIGNVYPSVPVAYSTNTKETYEVMSAILKLIEFTVFKWNICGNLKVIGILTGMQKGYTKFCCFLCEWDSRDKKITTSIKSCLQEKNSFLAPKTYHMNHL
ncbi:hypothetical protein AVEN_48177-1 [Araneus ventricosus]|uniref:Uncharacterized protein n=1 Tax=Araneus ventricosus TaxID=182803 RepID=A0A4Y2J7E1_ARAVE|nr:hypothetical protein AVEN_48177-1 [Araneus ventricosus]